MKIILQTKKHALDLNAPKNTQTPLLNIKRAYDYIEI